MSVPGVSGATMAILLGIYDNLIGAVSNFHRSVKSSTIYLVKFAAGMGLGIVSLAFFIKWLLDTFPIPVASFFLGAVLGGIPPLYRKTKAAKIGVSSALYFLLGLFLVITAGFIPAANLDMANGTGLSHYFMVLISGIVIALALVLPGISTSHMLLVLGMYDDLLTAITDFNIMFITLMGIVTTVGIFMITKPIDWTLRNFPHQSYCAILGFVIGSTASIFRDIAVPAIPLSAPLGWWAGIILFSVVAFALGYRAILLLSKLSNE